MEFERRSLRLYAVTDRSWLRGSTLYEQVEKALRGGATFIQLREKSLDTESFIEEAGQIKILCEKYHVPFVINDNVEVALAVGADGVHVGQGDMAASDARKKLGAGKIIGVTARTVQQAAEAERQGADYLGTGAVFATSTKGDAKEISHGTLKEICRSVSIPVVAIGGITAGNVMELKGTGIEGVAVVSAVFASEDIESAARELRGLAEQLGGSK
ncbi:thiamine phosphate synthase [bacterium 1xD8-6]|jgi:thiamine-phosphate pyrophosphorylase|nr:thiamine phosphate synthase [bacterium D16-36]RKI68353.1 thiamine phosphate synthase [bacterium 1xD8-6]